MKTILYLSLLVLLFIYSWIQITDGDIGHHLKAGEWMLANGKILARDIFSHTASGKPWLNHSWLAEIGLYYIYSLGGIKGLIFFKIIILFLSYALLVKASQHTVFLSPMGEDKGEGVNDIIIAILFIMSVCSASARFMVRPLIFTFLGVAISIYLFIKARKDINWLFFMPVLLMFWVNLHAEFMLGVIMITIFWLYATWTFFRKRISRSYFLKAGIIFALSLLALFINPYGVKLFLHPVSLTTSDLFMRRISEWLPPMHLLFRKYISIKFFYCFLGIGLFSFLLNFKKKNTLFFLFFITFGFMSLCAVRFMPYLAMIGIPIVAENLTRFVGSLKSKLLRDYVPRNDIWYRLAITVIIIWSIFLMERRTHSNEFGVGLAEKICYPLQAGDFLDKAGIKGNMFNMVDFGGYLILFHPERPVFADGRLDVYGEKIYKDFLSPTEDAFQKYNINYIFLSYRHPATRSLLYKNDRWPLIYWDDTALIYLKKSKENIGLINRYAYQYLHPLTGTSEILEDAAPEVKAGAWKEIQRALKFSPDSIRAHVTKGDIYVELNDYKNAIQAYEEAIKLGKKYNTAYMIKIYHNLGKLHHNLGEYTKAEAYYRKVLKMAGPGKKIYNQALEDWGQLAYVQGKKKRAFKLIKQVVRSKRRSKSFIFFDYPITLAKLALLYEDLGKRDKAVITWQEVYKIGGTETRQQAYEHLKSLQADEVIASEDKQSRSNLF